MEWRSVDKEPLNEYTTLYLATLVFPVSFPDGIGDPVNPCLKRYIALANRIKHLIQLAEYKDKINGCIIVLLTILNLLIGL